MHNSMHRNSVIIIQNKVFLRLPFVQHFQIIRSKIGQGFIQSAIDEFDRRCVGILGEKTYSLFSGENFIQNQLNMRIDKQSILNFIILFFIFFTEKLVDHISII